MNKLYTSIVLIITALALMSNSGGRGTIGNEAVTGAPGENGRTCGSSGCHSAGEFGPSISLDVISDASGSSKLAYKPGKLYTTRLQVTAAGSPGGYGFQMVALNDAGESVGQWTAIEDTQTVTLDGRSYIEHSARLTDGTIDVQWTSPDSDEGNVTFYFSGNAVNGTGSPAGDGSANSSLTIEYDPTLSTGDERIEQTMIYPNPAADHINVVNHSASAYSIYNVQGQSVQQGNLSNDQIGIANLNPGMYVLRLDNSNEVNRFIKI